MTSLPQLLLPADFLIPCLNAAVASLVACGIAVALSRRTAWSLPVRHALLAAALAVSLTAPLFDSAGSLAVALGDRRFRDGR